MKVLVDALPFRHGGGVTYLQKQLAALALLDDGHEYHTLLSPWTLAKDLPGSVETVPLKSVAHRFAYEQFRLPTRDADLLYCPANFAPLVGRRVPIVLTLHNPNYYGRGLQLPEVVASRPIWKVKANHWAIRRADAVVAISESLASEVESTLPSVSKKLHIIRSGAPTWPTVSARPADVPEHYFLSVASSAPHKRVEDIVVAWARARAAGVDTSLVLVGGHSSEEVDRFRALATGHNDRLCILGRVQDSSVVKWLYEHAQAAVSMSLLETFGFISVEAGSVGCPLILSDIAAHREVAGDKALYVQPRDIESLTAALIEASRWTPGSRTWHWPWTWEDNAREFAALFDSTAHKLSSR